MSYEGLGSLVEQIKEASANITDGDIKTNRRVDELTKSVNEIYLRQNRPGASWETKDDDIAERKDAIGYVRTGAP